MKRKLIHTQSNNTLFIWRPLRSVLLAVVWLCAGTAVAQNNAVYIGGRVFGGGNLAPVGGNTAVTAQQVGSVVEGDVYGGGAFADVGTDNSNTTTVKIFEGTFNGDIYGGALGRKAVDAVIDPETGNVITPAVSGIAAAVNGVVTVKIGDGVVDPSTNLATSVSHEPIIGRNVYGCNNANGTPKDNVTVHIFKTAHTSTDLANYFEDDADYAIDSVFGGGNKAHYQPTTAGCKTTVHVYTCDNTIQKVYGGGNAADVGTDGDDVSKKSATNVIIDGGRIEWVFGGGNGSGNNDDPTAPNYNPGANVFDDVSVTFRAGYIKYFFGGSNQKGEIPGSRTISILNDVTDCFEDDRINHIEQLYGGNNLAASTRPSNITLNMPCYGERPYKVDYLYGGSRNANFNGNITLNVDGGEYDYIFAGNNLGGTISGNVTLNLFGGTINEAAFGGNNAGGNVEGKITVNLFEQSCPLTVHNIYGGGQLAAYTPTTLGVYPEVNLIRGTVSKKANGTGGNVFGGGLGSTAVVASNPVVNVGYDSTTMASLVSDLIYVGNTFTTANVLVEGDVYGGGEMAAVKGSVAVNVRKEIFEEGVTASTTVEGDVYGGGALADVNVTTNGSGEPIYNDGTTTSVTLSGGTVRNIYGGGLGRQANQEQGISAVEAKVYGPVQVTVTGGTVTNSVYGCNNLNGAPQSTVNVDIYGTDPAPEGNDYALHAVYGGGNQANYVGEPVVVIHNCDNSIGYVYGGGNAASVTGTDVTVYGGNTIGEVYGGCYGADVTTDGTDVKIHGGKIGKVFGGNNASGSVTGPISVNVNKQIELGEGHNLCNMIIGEVYGGGNLAASEAGTITIGCTGDLTEAHSTTPSNIGKTLEGIGVVYGGANQANITNGTITLNINSGIIDTIFGGNNVSGSIAADIHVNINKNESETAVCPDDWYVGDVYGGGNHADCDRTPDVNIMAGLVSGTVYGGGNDITNGTLGVAGSDVVMTGGTVLGGVYGGCNLKGTVTGNSEVTILGGEIGSQALLNDSIVANVFGGGLGFNTKVNGNVTVTISKAPGDDAPAAPTIYGDVYGGSALGNVNSGSTYTTTVYILDGVLKTRIYEETMANGQKIYYYTGGNVYGGGLGDATHAAEVKGAVTVNIGSVVAWNQEHPEFTAATSGNATIGGNVYGCNNANGSPEQNVTVNVFQTAHTDGTGGTPNNTVDGDAFAIPNVFGGGNQADLVAGMTTTVNIYSCENTIGRVFGGGNAAATNAVTTFIQGGRFDQVFGGGNGERGSSFAADVNGNVDLLIHGGYVGQFFGGSNQNGTISGDINIVADNNGPCPGNLVVDEFFCGGNFVDILGNLETTIECSDGMEVHNLYGGCNMAHISGHVILNVHGGIYTNVYGGSKGDLATLGSGHITKAADIDGYVTLNLYGGTIENAFGGSNVNGNIGGLITVNVIDEEGPCPLYVTNIYGGSNMTSYTPNSDITISPVVNVMHAKYGVSGNVYGGSKGVLGTEVNVQASPLVNIGYQASTMSSYVPLDPETNLPVVPVSPTPKAIISGSVFGGGDAAKVTGDTEVRIQNAAKVFGNVYGGGNMGEITGNTKVIVNGIVH